MIIVRFRMQCRTGKADEVMAALEAVVGPSRSLAGVVSFDVGRDIVDPDVFIATEIFDDRAALERQEALPEVVAALAVLEQALAAEPEATIFDVSATEKWSG